MHAPSAAGEPHCWVQVALVIAGNVPPPDDPYLSLLLRILVNPLVYSMIKKMLNMGFIPRMASRLTDLLYSTNDAGTGDSKLVIRKFVSRVAVALVFNVVTIIVAPILVVVALSDRLLLCHSSSICVCIRTTPLVPCL